MVPHISKPSKYGSRSSVYFNNLQNKRINTVPDDVKYPLLSVQNILKIVYEPCKKDIRVNKVLNIIADCEINTCKEL